MKWAPESSWVCSFPAVRLTVEHNQQKGMRHDTRTPDDLCQEEQLRHRRRRPRELNLSKPATSATDFQRFPYKLEIPPTAHAIGGFFFCHLTKNTVPAMVYHLRASDEEIEGMFLPAPLVGLEVNYENERRLMAHRKDAPNGHEPKTPAGEDVVCDFAETVFAIKLISFAHFMDDATVCQQTAHAHHTHLE